MERLHSIVLSFAMGFLMLACNTEGSMAALDSGSGPGVDSSRSDSGSGGGADSGSVDSGPPAMSDSGTPPDSRPPSTDVGPPLGPCRALFCDDFEYEVPRDVPGASALFASHGWQGAKTRQDEGRGNGYAFTTDTVPGYSGALPGHGSRRVLVLEALPGTFAGQTDFYLQYGEEGGPIGQIPPNHWFQFWIYAGTSGDRQGLYTGSKLIYPTRTLYPASDSNAGYVYILGFETESYAPWELDACPPTPRESGCPSFFVRSFWSTAGGFTSTVPGDESDLRANLTDDIHVLQNQWTLVRVHVDISGTDSRAMPGQAVYEVWIRRQGDPTWTKTTEYIGGVTDLGNGPVNLTPSYTDGFRMIRMPTTMDAYDSWTYMDDFVLAENEADLPVYP